MPVRAARRAELNSQQPTADTQASSSDAALPLTSAAALQQGAQTGKSCSKHHASFPVPVQAGSVWC